MTVGVRKSPQPPFQGGERHIAKLPLERGLGGFSGLTLEKEEEDG